MMEAAGVCKRYIQEQGHNLPCKKKKEKRTKEIIASIIFQPRLSQDSDLFSVFRVVDAMDRAELQSNLQEYRAQLQQVFVVACKFLVNCGVFTLRPFNALALIFRLPVWIEVSSRSSTSFIPAMLLTYCYSGCFTG